MNKINIDIKSKYLRSKQTVVQRLIRKILNRMLRKEGFDGAAVNLLLVDNDEIKRYNQKYLRHNRVTDVIAFGYGRPCVLRPASCVRIQATRHNTQDAVIGDIVISAEKALAEARKREIPFEQEVLRYAVHGLLHILGYDDRTAKDRKLMWKRQEGILRISGYQ